MEETKLQKLEKQLAAMITKKQNLEESILLVSQKVDRIRLHEARASRDPKEKLSKETVEVPAEVVAE